LIRDALIRAGSRGCALGVGLLAQACVHVQAPASSPPSGEDALARMRASFACANAIQGSAKVDGFGQGVRARVEVWLFAARPDRIRMDVLSPFGVALATLTSNGNAFALSDLRDGRFLVGPATPCNLARLTTVAIPAHVLVDLLHGQAPVLKHSASAAGLVWSEAGYWVVTVDGANGTRETLRVAPRPEDWARPWHDQRLRVLDIRVEERGYLLYHAELGDHRVAATAPPRVDPDGLSPPLAPSGPACAAEIPRRIRVEVPYPSADLHLVYQTVTWNPPLPDETFDQQPPAGATIEPVMCEPAAAPQEGPPAHP
jgi:hypothetical protein